MPTTLPSEFTTQLDRLRARALDDGRSTVLPGIYRRGWLLPAGAPAADPAVPSTLKITRTVLNAAYKTALTSGADDAAGYGRLGALVAYKSAIDYLAALERSLQAEYANRNRAARWAAARRTAHGDATYGVVAAVLRDLQTTLAAAG